MPARYLDAHAHLADPRLEPWLESVMARAEAEGIVGFLQGGVGPEDWGRQRQLAARYPGRIFPVLGLHPWWVAGHGDEQCEWAFRQLERELPQAPGLGGVALGELGLDHGRRGGDEAALERQRRYFVQQLDLAAAREFPLVLHILKAHDEALAELERRGPWEPGGLVHSYSGSPEQAERYLRLGFLISVGGPLARESSRKGFGKLKETVVSVPGSSLVLETDAPDQPPPSHQGDGGPLGGLNEPITLWEVARAAGALRGESAEAVLARSRENLLRVFRGIAPQVESG